MTRMVIFDWGGVLLRTADYTPRHTWDDRLGLAHGSVEAMVHGIEEWQAVQRGEIALRDYHRALAEKLGLDAEQVITLLGDFYSGDQLDLALVGLIRRLRAARVRVGLLSNNTSDLTTSLAALNLADLFDSVVISADIGVMKPDPRAYRIILDRVGVSPQDAIFIDDSLENVEGARAVGMAAIHFMPEIDLVSQLANWLGMEIHPLPEALIFDYGNVIEGPLDEAAFQAELSALAAEHGFAEGLGLWNHIYLSDAWEQAKRGQISRDAFWQDRFASLGLDTVETQAAFMRRLFGQRGIRPAMLALLADLKPRYRLAVLSNTARRDFARHLAEQHHLDGYFEVVISSAEVGLAKPDPAIYQLALSHLGIAPDKALFIDDMERNTVAAEKLRITAIRFTSVAALRHELARRGVV